MNLGRLAELLITKAPVKHINDCKDYERVHEFSSCVCVPKINSADGGVFIDKEKDIVDYYNNAKENPYASLQLDIVIELLKNNKIISDEKKTNEPLVFAAFSLLHEEGHYVDRIKSKCKSDESYIEKKKINTLEFENAKKECDKLEKNIELFQLMRDEETYKSEKDKIIQQITMAKQDLKTKLKNMYRLYREEEVEKAADEYAISFLQNNNIELTINDGV